MRNKTKDKQKKKEKRKKIYSKNYKLPEETHNIT